MNFIEAINCGAEFYNLDSGCVYVFCEELGLAVRRDERDKPPFQAVTITSGHVNATYRLCDAVATIKVSELETHMNSLGYAVDSNPYDNLIKLIFGEL